MNKHKIVFNMLKNKVLFVSKRYEYNNNKISTPKNLSFLPIISPIVTRPFKSITKNESNEDNFDINSSKDTSNRKRIISIPKTLKEKMIKKSDLINIAEIDASTYYHLARNKENKLFSLMMNKIYDTLYEPSSSKILQRDNRIPLNKPYSCDFEIKYKRCCGFYIRKTTQNNNVEILTS